MTFTRHGMPSVQFGYGKAVRDEIPPQDSAVADNGRTLLQAAWWVSRTWVQRVGVHDPHRVNLIDLGLLIDDIVRANDYSPAAMMEVQVHLCDSCRRLKATPAQCADQSLHCCQLLKQSSH